MRPQRHSEAIRVRTKSLNIVLHAGFIENEARSLKMI